MIASSANTAATIRRFLYRFIFSPLLREQSADLTGRSAALLKIVIKVRQAGGYQNTSWFSDPSGPRPSVERRHPPASPLYVRVSVVIGNIMLGCRRCKRNLMSVGFLHHRPLRHAARRSSGYQGRVAAMSQDRRKARTSPAGTVPRGQTNTIADSASRTRHSCD
jgi:hypothetical protein